MSLTASFNLYSTSLGLGLLTAALYMDIYNRQAMANRRRKKQQWAKSVYNTVAAKVDGGNSLRVNQYLCPLSHYTQSFDLLLMEKALICCIFKFQRNHMMSALSAFNVPALYNNLTIILLTFFPHTWPHYCENMSAHEGQGLMKNIAADWWSLLLFGHPLDAGCSISSFKWCP